MELDKNAKPVGEIVLLKKLVTKLDKKYGDIYLPHTADKNCSMGVAEIVNMGDKAREATCLNNGDYVLYDFYSVFKDNPEYVLTKAENLIARITKEEAEEYIKNYVINE